MYLARCTPLATIPAADYIPHHYPGLEGSAWPCSMLGLAPTYQQDLYCPTLGTRGRSSLRSMEQGGSLCPFCPYFLKAGPCILGGPFRVEWTSVGAAIAPQGSL